MPGQSPKFLTALALVLALAAGCGDTGAAPAPSRSPSPSPAPSPPDPCAGIGLVDPEQALWAPGDPAKSDWLFNDNPPHGYLDAIWNHRAGVRRGLVQRLVAEPAATQTLGQIAVLQDQGDLVLLPNAFDLAGAGLRFTPNAQGGYDVSRADGAFRMTLGNRLTLADDDSAEIGLAFTVPFYGRTHGRAFVNSDGNVTFGEGDRESTGRTISRLLTGPPRVAPFFADLDPSAGGGVFAHTAAEAFTVTWCTVPGFERRQTTTIQATLLADGVVEMTFGAAIGLRDAVVGLSPGRTGTFAAVDLSAAGPTPGGAAALGERFSGDLELDAVGTARRFYSAHPDSFDQLVIWTDRTLSLDAFAYQLLVANEIRGIGRGVFDTSREFGSGGRLRSLVVMGWLGAYPGNPAEKFRGEDTALSLLAHETGHRWLAFLRFSDHNRRTSDALLGRQLAHWNFFKNSDASVMEGNRLEDLGGGSFRTTAAVERYSLLDQYAMGLVSATQVPLFFYVDSPVNPTPFADRNSAPQVGVTFTGTRRNVLIQEVIEVMGQRRPAAASSRVHRQAFIYVVSRERSLDPAQVEKLDRIRRAWEPFFLRATDGRMRVETALR